MHYYRDVRLATGLECARAASVPAMSTKPARARRTTEEVTRKLLGAAAEEFAANGFASTSMRQIAETAGVSLSVLHRRYETKQALFNDALVLPFAEGMDRFVESWRNQVMIDWDDERIVRAFVVDLYESLASRRGALIHLVSLGNGDGAEAAAVFSRAFASSMAELTELGRAEAVQREGYDPEATAAGLAALIALVVGFVLMEPWMPPEILEDEGGVPAGLLSAFALNGVRLSSDSG